MVQRLPLPRFFVALHQRPVDDPEHRVLAIGNEVEALGEVKAHLGEDAVDRGRGVGDDEQQVALLGVEALVQRAQLLLGEELGGRGAPAVALPEGPDEALRAQLLRT